MCGHHDLCDSKLLMPGCCMDKVGMVRKRHVCSFPIIAKVNLWTVLYETCFITLLDMFRIMFSRLS